MQKALSGAVLTVQNMRIRSAGHSDLCREVALPSISAGAGESVRGRAHAAAHAGLPIPDAASDPASRPPAATPQPGARRVRSPPLDHMHQKEAEPAGKTPPVRPTLAPKPEPVFPEQRGRLPVKGQSPSWDRYRRLRPPRQGLTPSSAERFLPENAAQR